MRTYEWNNVNWRKANRIVRNLRQRIFRATQAGLLKKLRGNRLSSEWPIMWGKVSNSGFVGGGGLPAVFYNFWGDGEVPEACLKPRKGQTKSKSKMIGLFFTKNL